MFDFGSHAACLKESLSAPAAAFVRAPDPGADARVLVVTAPEQIGALLPDFPPDSEEKAELAGGLKGPWSAAAVFRAKGRVLAAVRVPDVPADEQVLLKTAALIAGKIAPALRGGTVSLAPCPAFERRLPSAAALPLALYAALKFDDRRFKGDAEPASPRAGRIELVLSGETALPEGAAAAERFAGVCLRNVLYARLLGNLPGNVATPGYLAEEARLLAAENPALATETLGREDLERLGMNAYLAVARGSANPPFMSVITYRGNPASPETDAVIVGKGLTFDSGGLNLKIIPDMDEMMFDKCGAVCVLAVMRGAAALGLPLNLTGVAAFAENMPGGNACRPGDVVATASGLTVEIANTDAEGRMVLCEALTLAARLAPKRIIDIATLTGACVVALGHQYTGFFTDDAEMAADVARASARTADAAWRLPAGALYEDMIEGRFGDVANSAGRAAGASTAAAFLKKFAAGAPHLHLDIAGSAWIPGRKEKTATGRPVALMLAYLAELAARGRRAGLSRSPA